jgi:hypothetical protein
LARLTTKELHDQLDHLLWNMLVSGVSAWRIRGLLLDYVGVLEYFEHHDEIVEEIRRKRRWEQTPR